MEVSKLFSEIIQKEWEDVNVIDNAYRELNMELSALRADIVMVKANNPDIKPSDIKQELVTFKEKRYKESLLEDQYRMMIHRLAFMYNTSVVNKIELDVPEETLVGLKQISDGFKPIFFVNNRKEIEVSDDEIYNKILEEVHKSLDDEAELTRMFEAPIFEVVKNS